MTFMLKNHVESKRDSLTRNTLGSGAYQASVEVLT